MVVLPSVLYHPILLYPAPSCTESRRSRRCALRPARVLRSGPPHGESAPSTVMQERKTFLLDGAIEPPSRNLQQHRRTGAESSRTGSLQPNARLSACRGERVPKVPEPGRYSVTPYFRPAEEIGCRKSTPDTLTTSKANFLHPRSKASLPVLRPGTSCPRHNQDFRHALQNECRNKLHVNDRIRDPKRAPEMASPLIRSRISVRRWEHSHVTIKPPLLFCSSLGGHDRLKRSPVQKSSPPSRQWSPVPPRALFRSWRLRRVRPTGRYGVLRSRERRNLAPLPRR